MLARRVAELAIIWLTLFAHSACAFFDPPWITPPRPVADGTVAVNVRHGICDSIFGRDGFPRITQEGNSIHIVYYGTHYEPGDELCIFGIGTVTTEFGAFPDGTYTLAVDLLYNHPVFGPTILNIGIVPFTVSLRQQAAPVPVVGVLGILALAALLAGTAVWSLRTRAPNRYSPTRVLTALELERMRRFGTVASDRVACDSAG